jgi:tRNA pseudouridine38-40 synthase
MVIEYDGSQFAGWQRQANATTVQAEIERALKTALRSEVRIVGAGRTDAGVHARGQVAHADLPVGANLRKLAASLNALTPDSIAIHNLRWMPADFDARRSATARTYLYRLTLWPVAYGRAYVWQVRRPINSDALKQCAQALPGTHDFLSFCVAKSAAKGTECHVYDAHWRRHSLESWFVITANRFVHSMVRSLVGTMVDVAAGEMTLDEFHALLETPERRKAGTTAPAHGLCLLKVHYRAVTKKRQ